MELLNLIMGTDNIYRYLFVGGFVMIILSLFYPLEKRLELENQKNKLSYEKGIVNLKIRSLKTELEDANKTLKEIENNVKFYSKKEKEENSKKVISIVSSIESKFNLLEIQNETLKLEESKIKTLASFIKSYEKYEHLFFWLGISFSFSGLVGWLYMTHKKDK